MKKDLLVIERKTREGLSDRLTAEGYSIFRVGTGSAGLKALNESEFTHMVIFNAVSLRSSGKRICRSLKGSAPELPILVYSDHEKPTSADVLVKPGTTNRKLVNRIELYSPLDEEQCLQHGEIYLDVEKQRAITPWGRAHLSPKGLEILKYLIHKKGKVVSNEELFAQIWKTSYMGDMNTLYTSICYLRKAIEQDPAEPRYLVTVSGHGYRLDGAEA